MFRRRRIRRAATALTIAYPHVPHPVAIARAWQMVQRYPRADTDRITDYLIHGERVRVMLDNVDLNRESLAEETS
ncbi:hypothetical protein ACIQUY_05020 [Streptomyces sp. NPDC090231]|uniref:hypothetical protein n=1 Tax=unclassified Streptomyces TaxID=2593676 RepID=UPI00381AE935